ncbi:MAG: SUMF1/EgtB/PvdO family nonheme iron enzyme [Phototrophicaceae bacterium]
MADTFISYSRADSAFVAEFIPLLEGSGFKIWYDQHIRGGEDWWQLILQQIAEADVFIYLLSNDSLESEYCRSEFLEAIRLNKRVLPIVVRPKTNLERGGDLAPILKKYNYVDLSNGAKDTRGFASVVGALNKLKQQAQSVAVGSPSTPEHPTGQGEVVIQIGTQRHTFNHLTINYHQPIPQPVVKDHPRPFWQTATFWAGIFVLLGAIIAGIFGLWQGVFADRATPTPPPAVVAENTPTSEITPLPLGDTPTPFLTDGLTSTPMSAVDRLATANAQATRDAEEATAQAWLDMTATRQTATAQMVIDLTGTEAARQTQAFEATETAAQKALDAYLTLTALASITPTLTHTPTPTPTATATLTPTPTATLTALEQAIERARTFTGTRNADWQPFSHVFNDGVERVLVPVGCFQMGSTDGDSDEQPVHEQCVTEPFWLDKYEVTNALYGSAAGCGYSSEADQPRNCVTWLEAQAFCEARGGTLPSEMQWEYAARGVEGLVYRYPWGNDYDAERVIGEDDPMYGDTRTAPVGSRPDGASWVGAMDMSGNVREWTHTRYDPYPYEEGENRYNSLDFRKRVVRGGSFDDVTFNLRSSNRDNWNPSSRINSIGFRCALSLDNAGL